MQWTMLTLAAGLLVSCVGCSRKIEALEGGDLVELYTASHECCFECDLKATEQIYRGAETPADESSGNYGTMKQYVIFLVNKLPSPQLFRLFMDHPRQLKSNPAVFATSTVSLNVAPTQPGRTDTFTIPVQYQVGAGSGSNPIEEDCHPASFQFVNAELSQLWEVDYFTVPPPQGPALRLINNSADSNNIDIKTNPFPQAQNDARGWYSSQSLGIETAQGFIGMSWSPNPNQIQQLTPTLTFFVTVGSFGGNCPVNFTDIDNRSPLLNAPADFDLDGQATVTLTATGTWAVSPGAPQHDCLDR